MTGVKPLTVQMSYNETRRLCIERDDVEVAQRFLAMTARRSRRTNVRALFYAAVLRYMPRVLANILGVDGISGFIHMHHQFRYMRRQMPTCYLLDNALRPEVPLEAVERCLQMLHDDERVDLAHVCMQVDLHRLRRDARFAMFYRNTTASPNHSDVSPLLDVALPSQSLFYALQQVDSLFSDVDNDGLPPLTVARVEAVLYWLLMAAQREITLTDARQRRARYPALGAAPNFVHGVVTFGNQWLGRPEYVLFPEVGRAHFRCLWLIAREANSPRLADIVVRHFAGELVWFESSRKTRLARLLPCFRTAQLSSQTAHSYLNEIVAMPVATSIDVNVARMLRHAHEVHQPVLLCYVGRFVEAGYARSLGVLLDDPRHVERRDIVLHKLLENGATLDVLRGSVLRLFANRLLVSLALALHPLKLPTYIIEEIVTYIRPLNVGLRHIERIQLIENVNRFPTIADIGRSAPRLTSTVVGANSDTMTTSTVTINRSQPRIKGKLFVSLVADEGQRQMIMTRDRLTTPDDARCCLIAKESLLCNVCLFYRDPMIVLATPERCVCKHCVRV